MKKEIITTILASLLIFLFLYTSFSKIFDSQEFHNSMVRQPLPTWLISILLKTLPPTEIAATLLLIFPKTRLVGFYATTGLLVAFTIYIGMGVAHVFKYVPCSCGGVFKHISWPNHFYFNLLFLAIGIAGIVLSRKSNSSHPTPENIQMV